MSSPILELVGAILVKGGRRVLDDLTLTVREGEHLAILGPNGSGKSSLIQLLTRQAYPLYRPEGPPPIRLFGEERWNVTDLRRRMGIVSPDLHQHLVRGNSMGRLRALDAVTSGFFASEVLFFHHEVSDEMRAHAREALARVGAGHLAGREVRAMSTGEARRVVIARALVTRPEVLVLDEPTTGLDVVARDEFLADLRAIARGGTTLLLITHHVEEILPEIGRVVLLRAGRVEFDGAKGEVLTASRLGQVFGRQVEVREVGGHFHLGVARA